MQFVRSSAFATALLSILVSGCASPMPVAPLAATATAVRPTTVPEAFREATTQLSSGASRRLSVFPGRVPQVDLGGEQLLVVPVALDPSRAHTVFVKSYVTRAADGSHVLFYPLVSLVDSDFQVRETLKPKYEFAFEGARLLNEFAVPPGVARAIVHTDPQYFRGSFEGSSSTGTNPGAGTGAAVGALGGLVGALLLHAATVGEQADFRLGELGVIEIEAR